ncbi:hypothetical protein P4114_00080 [Pseudomonas aeruginosa]|nr:hypothetical protein [Pseudomonas aeruginosa]
MRDTLEAWAKRARWTVRWEPLISTIRSRLL